MFKIKSTKAFFFRFLLAFFFTAFVILLTNYFRNNEVNNIKRIADQSLPEVSPLFTKLGGKITDGVPVNNDGIPIIDLNSDGWQYYTDNYWKYYQDDQIETPEQVYEDKKLSNSDKINKICEYWKRMYTLDFKKKVKHVLQKYNWAQIIIAFIMILLNLPNKNNNISIGLILGSTAIIVSNIGFIYKKVNLLTKLIFSGIMLSIILYVGKKSM